MGYTEAAVVPEPQSTSSTAHIESKSTVDPLHHGSSDTSPLPQRAARPMLRSASQDPELAAMQFPGGREFCGSAQDRAESFQAHKRRLLAYARRRYHALQRFRADQRD